MQRRRTESRRFRVIGVLAPQGQSLGFNTDELVILPLASAQALFNTDALFRVLVEAKSREQVLPAKDDVLDILKQRHECWTIGQHLEKLFCTWQEARQITILEDLALKILYRSGPMNLRELSSQIKLSFSVVNELVPRWPKCFSYFFRAAAVSGE